MDELTPKQIVEELDKYIVGQKAAKRAVAIALRNRYRRQRLSGEIRDEVIPKNILMIGPTGVGKTEIARRLARLAKAPFLKVEATKFTEVGYVGRDVDAMVRDITDIAVRMVQQEKMKEVEGRAREMAIDRIVELLSQRGRKAPVPSLKSMGDVMAAFVSQRPIEETKEEPEPAEEEPADDLRQLREKVVAGELDDKMVEVTVEESKFPTLQVFSPAGMEEMGMNLQDLLGGMLPKSKKKRRVTVKEAKEILAFESASRLVDMDQVTTEGIERVEQSGIIFIDEMDKVAGRETGRGPDVSREGVQRDILPIVEGSTVMTKYGPVQTDHVLFVAAGAFNVSKPSDLIPELQGRFPLRVELSSLGEEEFVRILKEPKTSLLRQYTALLAEEGVSLEFTEEGIAEIAKIAGEVNDQTENIGARRLHTIMEKLLEEVSFHASEMREVKVTVDAAYVRSQLAELARNLDLSRYIL
ncbi:MAG: ATP-dependent protease ATPase subunit HslU [Armatimonadetes bacterium]|nr:ATP-dependent protease ATPase subunit HslU [Armatimonadota bacterium]NIM24944.1 ATP-dependent protease ATPase subunit HslU [Armatimonadota bacterium]NIM68830.1 ATP-dependent protease ATPase subunit HslU [Armatimonadota bacterium]NIM77077.1 ATP-dependent protease ATPase subunit HslU [Armatimonadota bacterium]NIN07035.1 ATP-dependent protease ATPase subunit HslU [Armatimonadota bacterium]